MNIKAVIEKGEYEHFIHFIMERPFFVLMWLVVTFIVSSVLIGGAIGLAELEYGSSDNDERGNKKLAKWTTIITFGLSLGFLGLFHDSFVTSDWEEGYAKPYLEQIPYSYRDVSIIDMDPVSTNHYAITYMYEQNGESRNTKVTVPILTILNKGERPKIRYKYLNQDLSINERYQKGSFDIVLLVPKNYQF